MALAGGLSSRWPIVLRSLALLIAVAAVVDPAITMTRRHRPLLSVVASDSARDGALVRDVERALRGTYTLVPAPLSAASGTVLVGDRLPDDVRETAAPVVVVSSRPLTPRLRIAELHAPSRATLESRVSVEVALTVDGLDTADSAVVAIELSRLAGEHAVVVARTRGTVRGKRMVRVTLDFVPTIAEPAVLRVSAATAGRPDTIRSDFVIDVRARRWSVLFFDRRPSWMSTFVRRSIERDPRFAVTSRIITSTDVSRETGRAPAGLDALVATEAFDVVVVGAPEALAARDVDGLRTLLRERGASVMVLADRAAAGPADGLLGFGGWQTTALRTPAELSAPIVDGAAREQLRLRGLAIGLPKRLPSAAVPLAVLRADSDDTNATRSQRARTVVWRTPIGRGDLVVSGAFDAWRYRDSSQSTFDATWRDLIEQAASQRQPVLDVSLSRALIEPRGHIELTVSPRDTANVAPVAYTIRSRSETSAPPNSRPAFSLAERVTRLRAPRAPGAYDLEVIRGADTAYAALVVASEIARDAEDDPALMGMWARSHGGQMLGRDELSTLPTVLNGLVTVRARADRWHPMRSAWWIIPFVALLSGEWWLRRRRGLA